MAGGTNGPYCHYRPATYEQVGKLVAEGKTRTEAFAEVAKERKSSPGTVAANYYRVARQQGASGATRKRRAASAPTRTTSKASWSRRIGKRRSGGSGQADWRSHAGACAQVSGDHEPGERCGKTSLLDTLEVLCARGWQTGRVTAAALYHKVEAERPTLLLDEADTLLTSRGRFQGALQNIVNQGYRANGKVSISDGRKTRNFSVYCPKAFAAIGELPDTVADRSIPLPLYRALPGEQMAEWDARVVIPAAAGLGRRSAGMEQHADWFRTASPQVPAHLHGREKELWLPLFAVAEFAGGDWPERARAASLIHKRPADEDSDGTLLLRDLHAILQRQPRRARFSMSELVHAQRSLDAPDYSGHLDTRELGAILRRYGIRSKAMRFPGGTAKGYERTQFTDVIARYVRD